LEVFLILVCVALTGGLFALSIKNTTELANGEFRRLTEDGVQVLRTRLLTYMQRVNGTAAFIASSDDVRPYDFESYVSTLQIKEQMPTINGIGWIVEVPTAELSDFADQMRTAGQSEFELRKLTDEDVHYIIKYIQPKETNSAALGLDVTFAPDRAEVLRKARDTGTPQMTPPIQLVQVDKEVPGFVLLKPIFKNVQAQKERGQFLGWINAAFVVENLLVGLTAGQGDSYEIQVVDGPTAEDSLPVFDDRKDRTAAAVYSATYQLEHFGRTWTMVFSSTPVFNRAFRSYQPLTTLIAGLMMTAFLVSVLRNVRLRHESLREIADQRSRQIKTREEEKRSIVENAVTSVLVLDQADKVLFANQAAQQCFGYSEVEMAQMRFESLASMLTDSDEPHNAIGHNKDGQTLELDLQRNAWLSSDGEARTTAIIRDLTEQNRAQRDLKRNKALYDMALQGAEIGVFDVDLTTGLSEVSETWCRIMGYEAGCNGMDTQLNFLSRIHPDDVAILKKSDADCIEGRTERSISEYRLKLSDGGWCWMRSDAVVVERDKDGKALRLIGTQTDITGLRRDRNALEASEKLFRQVLANAPIGMALMDDSGKFIGVNDAFCQLVGREQEELLDNGQITDLMPLEDRKTVYAAIAQMMTEDKFSVYTAEHRIPQPDGGERWGLFNVSWSFDKNRGGNFFITQIIDITDQKKLDILKSEFVSTVSHELRTPLTSIKGALGLLTASMSLKLDKGQARLFDIASSNVDRLTDIVNDILDLEKISSGEIAFNIDDLELNDVMETTVREMSPFASTHDNTLRIDLPEEPLIILADPGRMKQVLANLISNACKYSDPNSEVVIKAERIDDLAIVYIQNNGSGVPESFRSSIFKPFSQADSSDTRTKGGTGLGLNITRQIVLRHGGQIGFKSIPGETTIFWFTMPLSTNALERIAAPTHSSVPVNASKLSVLHIEDDRDFAEILSGALEEIADVTHARSLATAKRIINQEQLDVVILDWRLSDGDADTLLEEIHLRQPQARIIALSADGERENDSRLFASMIKSRTELATVVASVNQCQSIAS
jgi:PAS domain S-box-containing protein